MAASQPTLNNQPHSVAASRCSVSGSQSVAAGRCNRSRRTDSEATVSQCLAEHPLMEPCRRHKATQVDGAAADDDHQPGEASKCAVDPDIELPRLIERVGSELGHPPLTQELARLETAIPI